MTDLLTICFNIADFILVFAGFVLGFIFAFLWKVLRSDTHG